MLTAFGRGILNDWDRGLLETDDQWETFVRVPNLKVFSLTDSFDCRVHGHTCLVENYETTANSTI